MLASKVGGPESHPQTPTLKDSVFMVHVWNPTAKEAESGGS